MKNHKTNNKCGKRQAIQNKLISISILRELGPLVYMSAIFVCKMDQGPQSLWIGSEGPNELSQRLQPSERATKSPRECYFFSRKYSLKLRKLVSTHLKLYLWNISNNKRNLNIGTDIGFVALIFEINILVYKIILYMTNFL